MSCKVFIPDLASPTELAAPMNRSEFVVLHAAQHGSRGASKYAPRPVPALTTGPPSGEREPTPCLRQKS